MENNFSDGHQNIENEKDDEESRGPLSENDESSLIKEDLAEKDNIENTQSHTEIQKKVAENVKGVTSLTSHKDTDDNNEIKKVAQTCNTNIGSGEEEDEDDPSNTNNPCNLKAIDNPESVVRDLEKRNLKRLGLKKFPPQARHILKLAASLHISEGKGLTVGKLQELRFKKDNAEKIIQDARRQGLLIPGIKRKGKQKQYYLSNYKHVIDERAKKNFKYKELLLPVDRDFIIKLLQILSSRKYVYHNIHLETYLTYVKEDYDSIKWYVASKRNKQKIRTFKLSLNRNCSIVISRTGTVNVSIECTLEPYEFHSPSGLIEFIGSCGQALNVIQAAADDRLDVVPSIPQWYINQFDYNKDISHSADNNSTGNPQPLSWSSLPAYGRLQIEFLGTIFQIYPKGLPENGDFTRFEGHYFRKKNDKKNLEHTLSDIVVGDIHEDVDDEKEQETSLPFVTAEDLLKKAKEKVESEFDNNID